MPSVPGATCKQFAGARVSKKDSVLQISKTCALITDAGSDQRDVDKIAAIVIAPPLIGKLLPSAEVMSGDLKGQHPFNFFTFDFLFLLLGA